MKKVLIPLVFLLVCSFIMAGCSGGTTTTAPSTTAVKPAATTQASLPVTTAAATQPPVTTKPLPVTTAPPVTTTAAASQPSASASPASSAAPTAQPVKGGILREILASGPLVLSYYPEMGPGEENGVLPAEERLMDFGPDHLPRPHLCESQTVAPDGKSVTYKLRKGVKFSDGSDCNATAVVWNYQRAYDSGKMQFKARVKGIRATDDYTMVIDIENYDSQMQYELGWIPIFSKVAWDNAGTTDDARKAWARKNVVGTGPFILKEYKVDDHMTWVKNPNYWQAGKPYLDGIEIKFIPDSVTAATTMQAKQADFWEGGSITQWADLSKKGFKLQGSSGLPITIYINETENSKFKDQKLREAVEYALDKPAMAKALGQGFYTPLENSIGPDMWGYDPNFKGREYNPAKAKQLLADAGYPNGLKINLTALNTWGDQATAIKQFLDQVGFQTNIDLADPGRFFPMYWKLGGPGGWPDLLLFLQASSPNTFICMHRTFGPEPKTVITSYVEPKGLTDYFYESRKLMTIDGQKKAAATIATDWFAKYALVVPTWEQPSLYVIAPYVHTTYQFESVICRYWADEWMDKH
jgi:peptide/nickel transport system substrate-binding protein